MNLQDILNRPQPPTPWSEGDNIPWNEPAFSARMLAEHLTQDHDRASRRTHIIDQHVAWIHETILHNTPSAILDLGCGPGLYSNRLATIGHQCTGIDYSPASIAYAKETATQANLAVTYHQEDIRTAAYGDNLDLVMLLFGETNVFSRANIAAILGKACQALRPGGTLLLEAHTFDSIAPATPTTTSWFTSLGGLFSPKPHLVLIEEHWQPAEAILTRRFYVIDTDTSTTDNTIDNTVDNTVTRYAQSMQAYTNTQYEQLLTNNGFANIQIHPGLAHDRRTPPSDFIAITAQKPTA